jgi:diaminopimelate decarboxylase
MTKGQFPTAKFQDIQTPFYYYDTELLRETLRAINSEAQKHEGFCVHYAVKANANYKILRIIREAGLGADCVSGGEIEASVRAGFPSSKIVYAGVGKSDWEINLGLDNDIFCFNVESIPELEVINELAAAKGKVARVAFRLNPNVGAHTHANITTGLAENKFGIDMRDMLKVIEEARSMANVKVVGLHFHIGSQILDMGDFEALCNRVN